MFETWLSFVLHADDSGGNVLVNRNINVFENG